MRIAVEIRQSRTMILVVVSLINTEIHHPLKCLRTFRNKSNLSFHILFIDGAILRYL